MLKWEILGAGLLFLVVGLMAMPVAAQEGVTIHELEADETLLAEPLAESEPLSGPMLEATVFEHAPGFEHVSGCEVEHAHGCTTGCECESPACHQSWHGKCRELIGELKHTPLIDLKEPMPQHCPYYPPMHGYYYFRPYNHRHIPEQQEAVKSYGGDPRNPYSNDIFKRVYAEYESGEDPAPVPPTPVDIPPTPVAEPLETP